MGLVRRLFGTLCGVAAFVISIMMGASPHDAATYLCGWMPSSAACLDLLPPQFDKWAWLVPISLAVAALMLFFWVPIAATLRTLSRRYEPIPLHEAAAHIYGELRGTDLGRYSEGNTGTEGEILQNLGMQILHNADVYVRRPPSPNWELFPRDQLNKMGVCEGATGIRYWGQDRDFYSDPRVLKRDLRRVIKHLKKNAEWSNAPPKEHKEPELEIIFDPTNPGRKFWSIEQMRDEKGKPTGSFWEYRALIKNNSSRTLRNVKAVVEAIGPMPTRPEPSHFDINKQNLIDLNPQEEALALIRRWFNPPIVVGMVCGVDAYGPIKMTVSADDVPPTIKLFHFDPMQTPMIFE